MKLSKGRKITAWVTLSIMLVAIAVTACILTVPHLYRGEDVEPTNTATTAYGMSGVTYTTSNTKAVFADLNSGNDKADLKILFPTDIYLDKSENLRDVGYYFAYDAYALSKSGSNDRLCVLDNAVGYYASGNNCNVNTSSNAYTMHNFFPNYAVSVLTADPRDPNVPAKVLAGDTNIEIVAPSGLTVYIEDGDNGNKNHSMKIERRCDGKNNIPTNSTVKNYMTGKPDQSYDYITNNGRNGTFETQTGVTLAFSIWYGYKAFSGNGWY
ncbi:MAG: hypothetical protein K2I23_01340, partial [Clostridia bacterium]|nr:hypothetical protein [Clostridia bacterium]